MRIIPCLLMKEGFLVKGKAFANYRYIGDPINAVRIFNNKEVDEIIFLDISASIEERDPDFKLIEAIADECYMPFAVGGGIKTIGHIRQLLYVGAEKVCLNTAAIENPSLVKEASKIFGSQAIVVSVDVRRATTGEYKIYSHCGTQCTNYTLKEYVSLMEKNGAGEILINSIDRDGSKEGYDIELLKMVSKFVNVPVIALGGASSLDDFKEAARNSTVSALAAGSFFVFHGPRDAVLINYPHKRQLEKIYLNERRLNGETHL